MDRRLDSLSPEFRPLAFEFLARAVEAGILLLIVNTRRTQTEQDANVAAGVSWVTHSTHQDGDAIDVVPYDVYALHGEDKLQWDNGDPVWARLGAIGERLGLRWGGRWQKKDMGHFERVRR